MNTITIITITTTIIHLTMNQAIYWKYFFIFVVAYYIITQIILSDKGTNTSKKKFYLISWTHPFDSQIFLSLKVDITKLRSNLKAYNEQHKTDIHFTIFFVKVLAYIFKQRPHLNGNILFGKFFPKKNIDISCLVGSDYGINTEIITVRDVDRHTLSEIRDKVYQKKQIIDKNLDLNLNRKKFFSSMLPTFLLSYFLSFVSYIAQCGVNLSWLGLPKYFCGTAIVCNYGKIGIENTFLPILRNNIYYYF